MPSTKLQRWLDLIAYLVKHRYPVPVEDLMRNVPAYAEKWSDDDDGDATRVRASVRRTFERDKDELRRLGIPIRTEQYSINFGLETLEGYRIERRDFYLPYLRLLVSETEEGRTAAGDNEGADGDGTPREPDRTREGGTVEDDEARRHAARRTAQRMGVGEVELDAEEAATALEALRRAAELPAFPLAAEARSAFRKLAFDLDPSLFREAPILFVEQPGADELAGHVRDLSEALLARKRVRFRYHGIYRGEATDRDVAPYGLLFQRGHWYLIGDDATRDDVRIFRVGRMGDVVVNAKRPKSADYAIPDDFRLDDYARREAWELGDDVEAVHAEVLFHFPASLAAERNGHGTLVEERKDGSAVRSFEVSQVDPFVRWVLGQEGEAEVLGPPELAKELRRMARQVAAVYAGGDDA